MGFNKAVLLKRLCAATIAVLLLLNTAVPVFAQQENEEETLHDTEIIVTEGSYQAYLNDNSDASTDVPEIRIAGDQYSYASEEAKVEVLSDFKGRQGNSLKTSDEGYVEYTVDIEVDGLYNLYLNYYPIEGKASSIERALYIDGELPFNEAISISFPRIWTNAYDEIKRDSRGNDLLMKQVEDPMWVTEPFKDALGYYDKPYLFRLTKGQHVIRIEGVKEPVVIGELVLRAPKEIKTYEQVKEEYDKNGYKPVQNIEPIKLQAELPDRKSSTALAPTYDRSSPLVEPYSPSKLRLNIVGAGRWSSAGQWLEYDVEVPESGLYTISLKVKQNNARGLVVTRRVYINGELPFEEAGHLTYTYSTKWKMDTLGNEEEPYLFYLEKGINKIRVEASLGDLSYFCRVVSNSVYVLNNCYMKIVTITGTTPDIHRDYPFKELIPDVIETFKEQSDYLYRISREMVKATGSKSGYTAILDTLAYQLDKMYQKPYTIGRKLKAFKDNLSALGTWVLNVRSTDLSMDYLIVAPQDYELPRAQHNIWEAIVHNVEGFIASFFEDYSTIGDPGVGDNTIDVWINAGREQAQILKSLIDSNFTPQTGIGVNLKLVQGALLQATVAGLAPDVALSVAGGDPVNYAIRNAVLDLTQFEDFPEVEKRFPECAMTPLRFDGKVYGLPERIMFPMLFYREDILNDIGVEVPETWDDVYALLPTLSRYNMEMGIMTSDVTGGIYAAGVAAGGTAVTAVTVAGFFSFGMFLYQRDAEFFNEDLSRVVFNSEPAIEAMREWTDFYINRGQPMHFDFANRFRSGEMPLAIVDYAMYNMLTGFAPEIRNLWSFKIVPGKVREDGTINKTVASQTTPCMILKSTKNKEASWEFLKWWTDAPTQIEFGREIESLQGEMGRYPTANLEAIASLPWPSKDYKRLMEQFEQVKGIPEVPGGYYLWRHLDNAFRKVVNEWIEPREVMNDYNIIINKEIIYKRREFGLE